MFIRSVPAMHTLIRAARMGLWLGSVNVCTVQRVCV